MVLSIMVPHFPALGSGGMPPVPPTILMSESKWTRLSEILPPSFSSNDAFWSEQ
jgi:hypothetical protein